MLASTPLELTKPSVTLSFVATILDRVMVFFLESKHVIETCGLNLGKGP